MKRAAVPSILAAILLAAPFSGCGPENNPPTQNSLNGTAPVPAGPGSGGTPAATSAPAPADEVVATVGGQPVRMSELRQPLVAAYGLKVLLELVELDVVKQEAQRQGVIVTPEDVKAEHDLTMQNLKDAAKQVDANGNPVAPTTQPQELTPEETERLLNEVLTQRQLTRPEFDLVLQTNAYLRKLALPQVMSTITEDKVRALFNAEYGEKLRTRYIVLNNLQQWPAVKADLAKGMTFAQAAAKWSEAPSAKLDGGELPPFSRQDNRFPDEFKQVAFSLKDGEVSDPIAIKDLVYVVKAEEHVAPSVAKFEDYRDSVRKSLIDQTLAAAMTAMRGNLGKLALDSLAIKEPVLARQWQDNMKKAQQITEGKTDVLRKMDQNRRQRLQAATRATTAPALPPAPDVTAVPPPAPVPATVTPPTPAPATPPPTPASPATAPAAPPSAAAAAATAPAAIPQPDLNK